MPFAWRPVPGQVALIEVPGGEECITGVVVAGDDDGAAVVVDLGASPGPAPDSEVVASFFAPDALYRMTATATPHGAVDRVIDLRVHAVERVQRRAVPRVRVALPAVLSNFDEPGSMISVVGQTTDLGEGGCRVRTSKPFPAGGDPTLTVTLENGDTIVALAAILQASLVTAEPEYRLLFEYRLVFLELDDADRLRLADLVHEPLMA